MNEVGYFDRISKIQFCLSLIIGQSCPSWHFGTGFPHHENRQKESRQPEMSASLAVISASYAKQNGIEYIKFSIDLTNTHLVRLVDSSTYQRQFLHTRKESTATLKKFQSE